MLALIFAVLLTMVVFPMAPTSTFLSRLLVDPCVRRLNRVRPGHTAFTLALIGMGAVLFLLFEAEGLRLFSMMAPEIVVWFSLFDVAVLFDIFVVAGALAATTRLRAARDQALVMLTRVTAGPIAFARAARQRARRLRQAASSKPRRTDDPDPFGIGLAFA